MLPFMASPADATPTPPIKRLAVVTRLWHWINAIAVFILIGSGLGISNAHPRLYWGEYGANFDHAWLTLPRWPGWLTIPGHYNLALSRRWHLFRSEEHTSELQSLMRISYAVFCLKKKKTRHNLHYN